MSEINPSEKVQEYIGKMVNTFERGPFKKLRSIDRFSLFRDPSSIFGHTPSITAEDEKNRFYVMEVVESENIDLDETNDRLEAFAKKARISNSIFWIFVSEGMSEKMTKKCKKLGISEYVNRIKELSI